MKVCLFIAAFMLATSVLSAYELTNRANQTEADNKHTGTAPRVSYSLSQHWSGAELISSVGSDFNYFTDADPTHGCVNYGTHSELLSTQGSAGRIDVATGAVTNNLRNSIRLESASVFDAGLFVLDVSHMPEGNGTWPAFWSTGDVPEPHSWALYGEIDIIEGVNSFNSATSHNVVTLHTNDPRTASGEQLATCAQEGVPGISNERCTASSNPDNLWCGYNSHESCPNLGCGVNNLSDVSFGHGFNENGGGTYAMELSAEGGVTVWFWPKGDPNLPTDFTDPKKWSTQPGNKVAFKGCPEQFKKQRLIINTTLCGDWAGQVFVSSSGETGVQACQSTVLTEDYDVSQAYWLINSLDVYTTA